MSATRPSPACPASWRQESDGRAHFACAPEEAEAFTRLGYGLAGEPRYLESGLAGRAPLLALDDERLVRRFRRGGLLRALNGERYCDPSRPFREALLADELATRGLPVAQALAARATRLPWWGWRLELVVRRVPDSRDLGAWMAAARAGGPQVPPQLVRAAGRLLRRLHDAGFLHADLQPNNLLVVGDPREGRLVVLDLDGSSFHARLGLEERARNLARFVRFVQRRDRRDGAAWPKSAWQRLLHAYEPDRAAREELRRRVRAALARGSWLHRLGWAFEALRGERRR